MKTIFTLVCLLASILQCLAQDKTWQFQNPKPSGEQGNDVKFLGNNGWIVGNYGSIQHSTDGGITWALQPSPTKRKLHSISILNTQEAFAAGDSGIILYTQNGGQNWILQSTLPVQVIWEIFFTGNDEGWVATSEGLYKTTNKGRNWILNYSINNQVTQQILPFYNIFFADNLHGWATSYPNRLHRTTNGGQTWQFLREFPSMVSPFLYALPVKVSFVSATTGWLVDNYDGKIMHTTDGGQTWTTQTMLQFAKDVVFVDNLTGYALGSGLIKTTNGGQTWTTQWNSSTLNLVKFFPRNNQEIIGTAFRGMIVRSTDGGVNWSPLNQSFSGLLYDCHFTNENNGWAVGRRTTTTNPPTSEGILIKTTNGGTDWAVVHTSASRFERIKFVDTNHGMAWGSSNGVLYTSNGGNTWELRPSTFSEDLLLNFEMASSTHAWVAGNEGFVSRTTNAGQSWSQVQFPENEHFYYVKFLTPNVGFMFCNGNKVYKTTNGGNDWFVHMNSSGHDFGIQICVLDEQKWWAMKDGVVVRTTDGGQTWENLERLAWLDDDGLLIDPRITFGDSLHGYVFDEYFYETTDGGVTWQDHSDRGLFTSKVHVFNNQNAWLVGSNGLIMHKHLINNKIANTLQFPEDISIPYQGNHTTVGLTSNYSGTGAQPSPDAFFRFSVGYCTDSLTISTCGSGFQTVVHLLSGNGVHIATSGSGGNCLNRGWLKFKPTPNQAYYLVVEGEGMQQGNVVLSINKQASPVPIITSPNGGFTFCNSGILQASIGQISYWYRNDTLLMNQNANVLEANRTGIYKVFAMLENGCQTPTSQPVTVQVNRQTTPTVSTNGNSVCIGQTSRILTSSIASLYQWFKDGTLISGATNRSYTATEPGVYTVEAGSAANCIATSNPVTIAGVTPPQAPQVTVGGNGATTICQGLNVQLISSAVSNNRWYRNGTLIQGQTNQNMTVNQAGSYQAMVVSTGCSSTLSAPVEVVIIATPAAPVISGPGTVCNGQSIVLRSSYALGNQWRRDNVPINGATADSLVVQAGGTYSVRHTTIEGCVSPFSQGRTVTLRPSPPVPDIGTRGSSGLCKNRAAVLTTNSTLFLNWYKDNQQMPGATSNTFVAVETGSYKVEVRFATGCATFSPSIEITDPPYAQITEQPADRPYLPGESATFDVQTSGDVSIYQWQAKTSGGNFVDLENAGQFMGANTSTLTVADLIVQNNNQEFRCLVNSGICLDTSAVATLRLATTAKQRSSNPSIMVTPNPGNAWIELNGLANNEQASFELINLHGQVLIAKPVHNKEVISTSQLPAGAYYWRVFGGSQTGFGKWMKE